jgi:predicted RNase H-like HicB family nuclease
MTTQTRADLSGVSNYTFTANVYKEDDDYVAECAELGTVGQGRTFQVALDNLKEATRLYLQATPDARIIPAEQRADLIAGVRELEAAYAQELDEPIEPVNIHLVGTTTFTIEPAYA